MSQAGAGPERHAVPVTSVAFDPLLRARVVARRELRYSAGASFALDRPAHVRSASALASTNAGILVFQDDANFIAQLALSPWRIDALTLPAAGDGRRQFDKSRGNKALKLDIEAACVLRFGDCELALGFGSGSTTAREYVVLVDIFADSVRSWAVVDARSMYMRLRDAQQFSGSELNLEGAVTFNGANGEQRVRLFQRGNGQPLAGRLPVNATLDIAATELAGYVGRKRAEPPELHNIRQYVLPVLGSALTFTDACATGSGTMLFLCAAEASPNTVDDGPVGGVALGEMNVNGDARLAAFVDEAGVPLLLKTEGIVLDREEPRRAFVVVDRDDPTAASEWLEVELDGPWQHVTNMEPVQRR
jgi:hypothetical protein